jgi:hypothetical protein
MDAHDQLSKSPVIDFEQTLRFASLYRTVICPVLIQISFLGDIHNGSPHTIPNQAGSAR